MANDKDKKIIEEALERFKQAEEAENEFRQQFLEDLDFVSNEQWDPLAKQQRTSSSRPCFTIDHINPALRQIVNEERQNRPSIQVDPTGGGATIDVANVLAGMIRHIEQDSSADAAYDSAGWYAAAGGIGYLRVAAEYCAEDSFDQKLSILGVADPMTVFFDPNSVQPDGSDAEWAFIIDTMTKEEFEHKYPESKMLEDMKQGRGWQDYSTNSPEWLDKDSIRIAEYFYKDYVRKTLYKVLDNLTGEVTDTTVRPPESLLTPAADSVARLMILKERPTFEVEVKWCLLTSEEVLKSSTFEGKHIPVVPVYGERYFVDGKLFRCGAVYRAKDAQKAINFTTSLQIEIIDLNAKAPYIGAVGQFDSMEKQWGSANRMNYAFLEYNAMDVNGTPVGPPQRNAVEAPIQAVAATKGSAVEDIRSIFGVTDLAQQAQQSEISGVAILARKQQQSVSNYHYYDNLVRSVKQIGKILVDTIPAYYDTPRMVRIIKPNDQQELVAINQMHKGKMLDLSVGKYDIVVQTGPSYATRRQEMVESGISLIEAYPQAAPLIADLLADQMDFEGAKQMAKRLRAAVPPEILQATEEGSEQDAEALVPKLQSQVQQANQNLQALNAHCGNVEQELKIAQEENKLLKLKNDAAVRKGDQDYDIELKKINLAEQQTELEFLAKTEEIVIQKKQLEIEQSKLAISGVKAASDIDDRMFNKHVEHMERVATMQPGTGELNVQAAAPTGAAPADLTAPPSGINHELTENTIK